MEWEGGGRGKNERSVEKGEEERTSAREAGSENAITDRIRYSARGDKRGKFLRYIDERNCMPLVILHGRRLLCRLKSHSRRMSRPFGRTETDSNDGARKRHARVRDLTGDARFAGRSKQLAALADRLDTFPLTRSFRERLAG